MALLIELLSSGVGSLLLLTTCLLLIIHLATVWAKLRFVPGPLWASVSNFPRLYWVWTRKPFAKHIELHKKHGKLVRLGPNMVSVADPKEITTIYGFN